MNNSRRLENILFGLAFTLGLFIRLLRLGDLPLSDAEAVWALQALAQAGGQPLTMGPSPAYIQLTTVLFYIFSATDLSARLIPALFGALLPLSPLLLRERLPRFAGAIAAFGLAVDPGLVALSRTAGGAMIAVTMLFLAIAFWQSGRRIQAGACVGLALLAGPTIWMGLLILGLAWLLIGNKPLWEAGRPAADAASAERGEWLGAALAAAAAFLAGGSLLFISARGLGAALAALPAFLGGWVTPGDVPAVRVLMALPAYAPLALIFAAVGIVRGLQARQRPILGLAAWAGVGLVLVLAYPARQVADLIWIMPPLWLLAAVEITRYSRPAETNRWEVAGMFALVVALLTFAWMNLSGFSSTLDQRTLTTRLVLLAASALLLILSSLLVALGWSVSVARTGGVWGVLVMLAVYTLGAAWSSAGLRSETAVEFWQGGPQTEQGRLIVQTVRELSERKTGGELGLSVTLSGIDSPALVWLLREHEVRIVPAVDLTQDAPLVITPNDPNTALGASYRGQDFYLRRYPAWDSTAPGDWIKWLSVRTIAYGMDQVILWGRVDLFPDYQP